LGDRLQFGNIVRPAEAVDRERRHLLALANQASPTVSLIVEIVPLALQRLLDTLGANPAYVVGRRWDRLAWNLGACGVFDHFPALPPLEQLAAGMID
jgi:hypothetical protein